MLQIVIANVFTNINYIHKLILTVQDESALKTRHFCV